MSDFVVIHADSERLLVGVENENFKADVLVAHAPPSEREGK